MKCISRGMPLCPQGFPISAQEYLAKMQAASSFIPPVLLQKHSYVKKALQFVLQPPGIVWNRCTGTLSLFNTSNTPDM